jgi:hypothetical protein
MGPLLKDASWVRQSFLVEAEYLEDIDLANRTFSSVSTKFTDTTPGGSFAINAPPQFTRHADIKRKGIFVGSKGMGRYYSEAIDDNSRLVHMRFGVPQFNSLTTFFTGFYNSGAGQLARTGRSKGLFFLIGRAVGFVVTTLHWLPLAVSILGYGLRFFLNKPSSKFYYLKPTMGLYWNAVTTIVNQLAVYTGVIPRSGGTPDSNEKMGDQYEFDAAALQKMHELLPDIFKEGGGIDVYALANRAQRLANRQIKEVQKAMEEEQSGAALAARLRKIRLTADNKPDLNDHLSYYWKSEPSKPKEATTSPINADGTVATGTDPTQAQQSGNLFQGDTTIEEGQKGESWWSGFKEFLKAELDDGSAFATFRVDAGGSVSETFSSTVTESEIANKINDMSSENRKSNFNFAGGNIIGGALGSAVGMVTGAVKDLVAGIGEQIQVSGLAALGGSAFVDIPKHWQNSSASVAAPSYTFSLISPYGNPISLLTNIYIPLAMLLAGSLPLSTGKQSYTSPFICELYDQGRCQTRLGMIDNLQITRGGGNLGFTNEGQVLQIDVSFSVVDMSSVLHMPITSGFSLNPLEGVFDDETIFTDYMAVLAGLGLADQIYPSRKMKLNWTRKMANWDSFFSTTHFTSFLGDTPPGRLFSAFYRGTSRF